MTVQARAGLFDSFGVAAAVVVVGVLCTATLLRTGVSDQQLMLPAVPVLLQTDRDGMADAEAGSSVKQLLRLAEDAVAAGAVLGPADASALAYYQRALALDDGNEVAAQGLAQLIDYALNEGEAALFQNDWSEALRIADQVLAVQPDDRAGDLRRRTLTGREVEALLAAAEEHLRAGRIDRPRGGSAADSYRQVLKRQRDNSSARAGLRSLAQRLVAKAQTLALAGDRQAAFSFIDRARAVDPRLPTLKVVSQSLLELEKEEQSRELEGLLKQAAEALAADRLRPPAKNSAYAFYQSALALAPESSAARRGRALTLEAILNEALVAVQREDIPAAQDALAFVQDANASSPLVAELQEGIAYAERMKAARAGELDAVVPVSRLVATRQFTPEFPSTRVGVPASGWVELLFTVSEQGRVVEAEVLDSSSDIFHRSALAAIRRWRFEPYVVNDRAVPVRSGIRFAFKP